MKRAEDCVFCGAGSFHSSPALIASFVRERALDGNGPDAAEFRSCSLCGGGFFVERFEEPEMLALYRDYRGPEYLATRRRHEFWYSEALNRGLGGHATVRREFVASVLRRAGVVLSPTGSALDFGGDTGELFPGELAAERCWVVDPSGVAVRPPVRAVRSLAELPERGFELALAAQVFEHLAEPRATLARLAEKVTTTGAIYLEVPDERVLDLSLPSPLQRPYLGLLRRAASLRRVAELGTLVARSVGVLPPFGFRKLHEHINLFSEEALRRMAPSGFVAQVSREELLLGRTRVPLLVAVYRAQENL